MINRCKICDSPCSPHSDLCKTCAFIEEEERRFEEELDEDLLEEIDDE